jgi:hypothetical protein
MFSDGSRLRKPSLWFPAAALAAPLKTADGRKQARLHAVFSNNAPMMR